MGGKPKTYTRADRRLKENKSREPYTDRNSHIRPRRTLPETLSLGKDIPILNRMKNRDETASDKKE